jgi:hypothetical protein
LIYFQIEIYHSEQNKTAFLTQIQLTPSPNNTRTNLSPPALKPTPKVSISSNQKTSKYVSQPLPLPSSSLPQIQQITTTNRESISPSTSSSNSEKEILNNNNNNNNKQHNEYVHENSFMWTENLTKLVTKAININSSDEKNESDSCNQSKPDYNKQISHESSSYNDNLMVDEDRIER